MRNGFVRQETENEAQPNDAGPLGMGSPQVGESVYE